MHIAVTVGVQKPSLFMEDQPDAAAAAAGGAKVCAAEEEDGKGLMAVHPWEGAVYYPDDAAGMWPCSFRVSLTFSTEREVARVAVCTTVVDVFFLLSFFLFSFSFCFRLWHIFRSISILSFLTFDQKTIDRLPMSPWTSSGCMATVARVSATISQWTVSAA
jgi:hypothetical protein